MARRGGSGESPPWLRPAVLGLAVAGGGAVGTLARYAVAGVLPWSGTGLPWATLAVNLVGAFVLGLLVGRLARLPVARAFWQLGLLASLTTFSAYAVELVDLGRGGAWWSVSAYLAVSTAGGLAAALAGLRLAAGTGRRPVRR